VIFDTLQVFSTDPIYQQFQPKICKVWYLPSVFKSRFTSLYGGEVSPFAAVSSKRKEKLIYRIFNENLFLIKNDGGYYSVVFAVFFIEKG
jgi:hypothetical protein